MSGVLLPLVVYFVVVYVLFFLCFDCGPWCFAAVLMMMMMMMTTTTTTMMMTMPVKTLDVIHFN